MISLAIVQGMAIGGGAEMTTACDYRLMTKDSVIGFVHIKIGIMSAWGGGSRLTQLIGPQKALDMMTTGRTVDSGEALGIGLVDGIIEDNNNAINESKEWLKKYIKYSAETIRAAKGIVNGARYLPLQLALQEEIEYSASVWGGRAHKKALDDNIKHRL
jgi:ethylmalonyl-CoA/methylmalonyl-CoA decarboxylase